MNKIFTYSYIIFKRILKNVVIYTLCLLIPACMLLSSFIEKSSAPVTAKVGLFFESEDDTTTSLSRLLTARTGAFEFVIYNSPDLLENDVCINKLECGYIFPENFSDDVSKGHMKNSVILYVSPSTVFHSAIDEIIFSDIMKLGGYAIMDSELKLSGGDLSSNKNAIEYMHERYRYYCDSSDIFHVTFETADCRTLSNENDGISVPFPSRGLISVIIFLAAMTGTICFVEDNDKGIFSVHSKDFLIWSRVLYVFIPALFFTLLGDTALFFTANAKLPADELIISIRYIFILVIFSNLCITILQKKEFIFAIIPVVCLASLIFCPILVNLATTVPAFAIIQKLLIPYYFL